MRKSNLTTFQLITNGNMSANITSNATDIRFLDNIGIQCNVTSSNGTGTIQPRVSEDYKQDDEGNVINPGNWIPITGSDGVPVRR